MATLSVQVNDAHVPRILDALAKKYRWDPGGGLTKAQFARVAMARLIKAVVLEQERQDRFDADQPNEVDIT